MSTRERIMLATLQVIDARGVDAVTHRAVATQAGVSPGTTTHHFASREDLVREAFRAYLREGEAILAPLSAPVPPGDDVIAHLEDLLCRVVDREFAEGLVRAEYELFLFACTDAELALDLQAWEARVVGMLATLLEAGGADRPVTATRTLFNLQRGYELERLLNPSLTTEDFRERLRPVLWALLNRP